MNTKVEEALAHVGQAAEALEYAGANQLGVGQVRAAREALALRIAQQDATIARLAEALREIADAANPDTPGVTNVAFVYQTARAALNQEKDRG